MEKPFLRTPYNYDRSLVTDQTGLHCEDPSLAQQQFKHDSDPNTIIATFAKTRDHSLLNVRTNAQYGDFTGIGSYQDALNRVISADAAFMDLPSAIRARFGNDPQQLLDFVQDDANYDEAVKIGLISKKSDVDDLSPPDSPPQSKSGGGKSVPATPATKKSSSLKTKLSELLNDTSIEEI